MTVSSFPLYPDQRALIELFQVSTQTLSTVRAELIRRNPEYDFCFLSTTHIVSLEQLHCAINKALQNKANGDMKANSLNTEIILNLSPVNNINDALKRFGIDDSRDDVIAISILDQETDALSVSAQLSRLLGAESLDLSEEVLFERFDEKKFKKLFKLQEVPKEQRDYTRGAIAASLLRGL